jgi:arylsulfatase A-like enzyme
MKRKLLPSVALALFYFFCGNAIQARENKPTVLLVVMDGMRPDYITPEFMPNLHALGKAGVVAERHHSTFPTVTRVNASSIATGCYPATHGILENKIFIPAVSSNPIDVSEAPELLEAEEKTHGKLLTTQSLGELMAKKGKKLFVAGSSSTGTSFLLNHKITGDGVWNSRGFVKPDEDEERATKLLGAFPKNDGKPFVSGNRWAVRAILEHAASENPPDAMILWITDPDGVAHGKGIGSPEVLAALRHVDGELGFLLDGLKARGLKDKINIFVSTDHGFSTYTGGFNLNKLLGAHSLEKDVTLVKNQIYVKGHDEKRIKEIVRLLQAAPGAGAIFTRAEKPGSPAGFVPGTLSFDLIHWNHERAADIFVDSNWSDATNAFGFRGTTTSSGTAGHGTSSPFDLNIRLLASGPAFKRALRSEVPTGNIDLAPTILHLLGIEPPSSMDGRILKELLRDGPSPRTVAVKEAIQRAAHTTAGQAYEVELKKLVVGDTDYIDYTKVNRRQN